MKDTRWVVRANSKEKEIIEKVAREKNMSVSDYIKYRLFHSNPHLQDTEYTYETITGPKHDYLMVGTEYYNHYLIRELLKKLYPEDEEEMRRNAHRRATQKINYYGYKKHLKTDNNLEDKE